MADTEDAPKVEDQAPPPQPPPEGEQKPQEDGPPQEGEAEGEGERKSEAPKLRMDFVFDDEKKKKKKGKKGKPKPPKRPTRPEYEGTIIELNATLAALRKSVAVLDKVNVKHTEKLVEIKEQHHDVSEHLRRVFEKHTNTLIFEEEYNVNIIKKQEELDIESAKQIGELSKRYKATHSQLSGEIEMLSTKLSTLRVFSDARNDLLAKFASLESDFKQSDQAHQDRLYKVQQKAVVERNILDKEAKARFQRIIDDFTLSREVRNAAYTRRLLSENSMLRRKYNKLIPINLKKERKLMRLLERTSVIRETHTAIHDITKQLERTQIKRDLIMEKLRKFYNFYRLKVVEGSKYRRLYEALKRHEQKESEKYTDSSVLVEDIGQHTEMLRAKHQAVKQAERDYLHVRQQYDHFVEAVKLATFALCHLENFEQHFPQSFGEYVAKRNGIIRGLVDLLNSTERSLDSKVMLQAAYYRGYLGFMPLDYMMCQIFKCKDCEFHAEDIKRMPSFCLASSSVNLSHKQEVDESSETSDPGLLCLK